MFHVAPSSNSLPVEQFQRLAITDKDDEYETLFQRKDELKTQVFLTSISYAVLPLEVQGLQTMIIEKETTLRNEIIALRNEMRTKEAGHARTTFEQDQRLAQLEFQMQLLLSRDN